MERKTCAKCRGKFFVHDMYEVDFCFYNKPVNICGKCILMVLKPPSLVYPERDYNNRGYSLNVRRVQALISAWFDALKNHLGTPH